MRSVLCGLVASVIACGTVQADGCALDRASLTAASTAKWSSEISRPDLVGRTFRVEKVASRWRAPKVAEISLVVRSGDEAFLIQQVSDFSDAPVDTVLSASATDKAESSINWASRSFAAERAHFHGSFDGIAVGPLTSLTLSTKHCT